MTNKYDNVDMKINSYDLDLPFLLKIFFLLQFIMKLF